MRATRPNALILMIFVSAIAAVLIGESILNLMESAMEVNPLINIGIGILFVAVAFTYFNRASARLTLPILGGLAMVLIMLGLMGVGS